jgi:hypothetical protein
MKKYVPFLFAAFCLAPQLFSQSNSALSNVGERNRSFLALCKELADKPVIKGDFKLSRYIASIDRTLVSSGTFIISADKGMIWDTKKPFTSVMAVGSDYIIQISRSGKRSVVSAEGNETFLRIASVIKSLFSGNPDALEKNFVIDFNESGSDNLSWTLKLSPKDVAIRDFASLFTLSGTGGNIQRLEMSAPSSNSPNGDSTVYLLSNQTRASELTPAEEALFEKP